MSRLLLLLRRWRARAIEDAEIATMSARELRDIGIDRYSITMDRRWGPNSRSGRIG